MKKKILFMLPLLFGFLVTSCSNEPKTEPIEQKDFIQNLNNIKKQAQDKTESTGIQFTSKQSLETDITLDGTTLKLLATNEENIKVNNNKFAISGKVTAKGETLVEDKPEKVTGETTANLYGELKEENISFLLDVDANSKYGDKEEKFNKKVKTYLDIKYDKESFEEYLDVIKANYVEFTTKYVEELKDLLKETPLAKLEYGKKGETEVFTLDFDLKVNEFVASSQKAKLRFDGSLLTKMEVSSSNQMLDEKGNIIKLVLTSTIEASKYNKEISLPDSKNYEEITFDDFDSIDTGIEL